MTIVRAHFTLLENAGVTSGRLDAVLRIDEREVSIENIAVDIVAAARNDERALIYPPETRATLDDDVRAAATAQLIAEIRLLTRRRTIPLVWSW